MRKELICLFNERSVDAWKVSLKDGNPPKSAIKKIRIDTLHIAVLTGQQGHNVRPVRAIIGGQQAA